MGHDTAEVELDNGPQEGAGGGGVQIGSAEGHGGRKNAPQTKVSKGPHFLLEANG